MRKYLAIPMLLVFLAGCAELGINFLGEESLTQEQRLAAKIMAGYAVAEQANRVTSALLRQKKISSDDAQNVLEGTRAVRRGLDLGKGLIAADIRTADAKVASSLAMLEALEDYLKQRSQ